LTDSALIKAFASHPLLTIKVIAGIHWHALRMILKGFRVHAREPAAQRAARAAGGRGTQP
jgi:DUF1365 family protein